jgi:hypothetical protein
MSQNPLPKTEHEHTPSPWVRVVRWFVIVVIGYFLGNYWLEPLMEPVAVGTLYGVSSQTAPPPRVRFIDLSHLYKTYSPDKNTLSPLPADAVAKVLDSIEKLPPELQPAAIGIDFPIVSELPGQPIVRTQTENQIRVQKSIEDFHTKTGIPIRCGIPFIENRTKPSLFASSLLYYNGETAPLWYGRGNKNDTFLTLGTGVALDAMSQEKVEPEPAALTTLHDVAPPADFPKNVPARWAFVDYSLLKYREELTVTIGRDLKEGDKSESITPEALFTEEDRKKLESMNGHKNIWFIGVTEIVDKEDIFTYDERLHWIGEAEPVRRIYQHGAIAHTYRENPLRRLSFGWAVAVDFLCSLCGLMFVLHHDRKLQVPSTPAPVNKWDTLRRLPDYLIYLWGGSITLLPWCVAWLLHRLRFRKRGGKPSLRLVEVLGPIVLIPLPIFVSLFLARYHIFWFGFIATALYGLIEPILDGTVESFDKASDEMREP